MIDVKQEDDNTFTIYWDENDPKESILNTWTEEDFINAIQNKLQSLEELGVLDNATEAINQINDHIEEEFFIDQTPEEVNEDIQTLKDFIANQGTEQSQDRTVPPPNFPLFPWWSNWKEKMLVYLWRTCKKIHWTIQPSI